MNLSSLVIRDNFHYVCDSFYVSMSSSTEHGNLQLNDFAECFVVNWQMQNNIFDINQESNFKSLQKSTRFHFIATECWLFFVNPCCRKFVF